ncbi:MAG: hypothetical protein CTY10_00835 [Methylotenera sp.]|nr:MAG: hypothetical protein CTY10_00835 [Methylotenera sp.]
MAYIYIMANKSMPGLIKVGFSERQPSERASELYTTGVPLPFKLVKVWEVVDAIRSEKDIHVALSKYRISNKREFFRLNHNLCIQEIDQILGSDSYSPADHIKLSEKCAFINCKRPADISLIGRYFCLKCGSKIKKATRQYSNSDRASYYAANLKPLERY